MVPSSFHLYLILSFSSLKDLEDELAHSLTGRVCIGIGIIGLKEVHLPDSLHRGGVLDQAIIHHASLVALADARNAETGAAIQGKVDSLVSVVPNLLNGREEMSLRIVDFLAQVP